MSNPTPNFYAIIPAHVRYCKDIEPNAKLLYGEITALCHAEGYCWAHNKYFAELYDVDESTVKRWITSLKEQKFIYVEVEKDGFQTIRKIWISPEIKKVFTTAQKCTPGGSKMHPRGLKNAPHNITSNNTSNREENTKEEKPGALPPNPLSSFSKPPKRKKEVEPYVEVAPRVFLTASQQDTLKKRSEAQNFDLQACYMELSDWKLGKQITGGSKDFKAIVDWTINAVKEKAHKFQPGASSSTNEALTKKIEERFSSEIKKGNIRIGYNYIEFVFGSRVDHAKFDANGFRDICLGALRKMNLSVSDL